MCSDLIRSGLLTLKVKAIDKEVPEALQTVVTTGRDSDYWHQISFCLFPTLGALLMRHKLK